MKRKYIILLLSLLLVLSVILVACNKNKGGFEWDEFTGTVQDNTSPQNKVLDAVPAGEASEPSVQIHYRRSNSADYKTWGLWLWTTTGSVGSGTEQDPYGWKFNYQDDFGAVALYKFSELGLTGTTEKLGMITKKLDDTWTKDGGDRFWDLSAAEKDSNNYYHVYLVQGDAGVYESIDSIAYNMTAAFTSDSQIAITTSTPVTNVKIYEGDTLLGESKTDETVSIRYNFAKNTHPDLNKTYTAEVTFKAGSHVGKCNVDMTALYSTDLFNNAYYYDGELGAIYTSASTTFKVWSPVSTKITLNIYEKGNGTETPATHEMTKGDKGVWEATVNGDQGGKYYTYTVYNSSYPTGMEIVDPYAKSAGLNGQRGQIVDFSLTNPDGWDKVSPKAYDLNELVVWETHVADVTSSTTWNGKSEWRKKFLGMTQTGTTYQGVSTGFDHIKELGVNAVQLVPIFDQANDEENVKFNWGYNPLNYNVLEGAYSTDATNGYVRIEEFKKLVQAYNEAGINIIMDVVYNHVSGAIASNFDVLMPGYYFRYEKGGELANGSGCGNETASDHAMFRKFMIDSVKFWAKEYKLGGFRFDLMGLHDIDTMNALAAELKKINPSIVIYGEPWTGGTTPLDSKKQAIQANANSLVGVGQFNDQMRDALIKGGMNPPENTGWITSTTEPTTDDVDKIVSGLKGITDRGNMQIDITRTVNYVTCHDNYTLVDRIWATGLFRKDNEDHVERVEKMAMLANSVVLTSNGINFMLAGEEFLRTKGGNDNSYESSYEVNELNYALKVENKDIFENYKALIAFKTSFKEIGLAAANVSNSNYVVSQVNSSVLQIVIKTADNHTYKIVHANGYNKNVSKVSIDFDGFTLKLDTLKSGVELSDSTAILPYQTIIAYK